MLFNSYIFILVFLPISLTVFFALTKYHLIKSALIWLSIASLFFYSYWQPLYLPLFLVSLIFNFSLGGWLAKVPLKSQTSTCLLWIGITVNLGLIAYYKYSHFLLVSLNNLLHTDWPLVEVSLPLAISFYTFTQIAYLVDAYRGETRNLNYDLFSYTLFITFFPHLIAGPIVLHKEIIPQFRNLRNFVFSHKNTALGLTLFVLGLGKKVLIADTLSPWVANAFNHTAQLNFIEAWFGAISYTLQLYFDFSGYSDMAIGLGLLFNIILPINFNSPYKASSITDFWRRWHITLSNFLRDYLYIPLGGNRKGETRRYINLMTTMLLGGLWHGAGWNFILWGGLHGLYLSINHGWRKLKITLPEFVGWLLTFLAVVVSWVLFRSSSLQSALEMLQTMSGVKGLRLPSLSLETFTYLPVFQNLGKRFTVILLLLLMISVVVLPNTQSILQKFKPTWQWAISISILFTFCLLSLNRVSEFLYFQF